MSSSKTALLDPASLSSWIYFDNITSGQAQNSLSPGWTLLDQSIDNVTGFQAAALLNPTTHEIVISVRGTVPKVLQNIGEGLELTAYSLPVTNPIDVEAASFAEKVAKENKGAAAPMRANAFSVELLFICHAVFALSGCGSRSTEAQPGEAEYPRQNDHPFQVVDLKVVVPPTLSMRFWVIYSASKTAGGSCQRAVGLGVTSPAKVRQELLLTQRGDAYSGTFALDRYAPGPCGWQFSFLGSESIAPQSSTKSLAEIVDGRAGSAEVKMDVWCIKYEVLDSKRPEYCAGLTTIAAATHMLSSQFLATVPASERNSGDAIYIGPDTRSIFVEFHDIDAIASATPSLKQ